MRHFVHRVLTAAIAGVLLIGTAAAQVSSPAPKNPAPSTTARYEQTLSELCAALRRTQNDSTASPHFGGLRDPETGHYYSRAAEAVFPFAVMAERTRSDDYRRAAIRLGNWLLRQQKSGGEWVENPWAWTGTTADQLLMMAGAYPLLQPHLSPVEHAAWRLGMARAADYLVRVMSPEFASINYVPSTAAALAVSWQNIERRPAWQAKARLLAEQTLAKMDDDQFIEGEAARYHNVKYGVDIGYQLDMSLWGLAVYARTFADTAALGAVRSSLAKLLYFVYPNGMIDASWGARCYKWTGYGSKTADGAQVLFSLFAKENPVYQTAATRNLDYLRACIQEGYVGYGKHIWGIPGKKANLYPTFARAKNLAMALQWGDIIEGPTPPLPTDGGTWARWYPTVSVGLARIGPWLATASAYPYQDRENWGGGKYHHFPRGGALCNLYLDGWGLITTSSQTLYRRGEHIHMPAVADSLVALTPRVEYRDRYGYFTNLYDSDARLSVRADSASATGRIVARGELSDSLSRPGGVAYAYTYDFTASALTKRLDLRYHDRTPTLSIQEPIVLEPGVQLRQLDDQTVLINRGTQTIRLRITAGEAKLRLGDFAQNYWFPFPGLRCAPITMELVPPRSGFVATVEYRFELL